MKKIILLLLIMLSVLFSNTPNACDVLAANPKDKSNPTGVIGVNFEKIDVVKARKACTQAVKDFPNEPRYSYQLGRVYHKMKEYKKAFEWYKRSAEQNNTLSQYELIRMYHKGVGTKKNQKESLKWLMVAAKQGSSVAQGALGMIYRDGDKGLKQDYKKAIYWYKKSAEQNVSQAQNDLGEMYYYGEGVEKDYKKAFKWYMKAAKQNNPQAQNDLGEMYYYGEGVEKDYKKAFKWYMKAAKQGNTYAQAHLGDMYYSGEGVEKDYKEAFKWYMKAAKQGNAYTQAHLGYMYYYGEGVEKDYKKAFKWYMKAAKKGNAYAQGQVGQMYIFDKAVKKDEKEAFKWAMKGAKQGDADAQYILGAMYINGTGTKRNYKKAFQWRIKAAKQNYVAAQLFIAIMYEQGHGVKRNYIKAYAWYNIAATNNKMGIGKESMNKLETKMTPQQIAIAQSYDPLKEDKEIENKLDGEKTESSQRYIGTGFFVDKFTVLTNNHVVKNCKGIELIRMGYRSTAKIKAKDSINDLAILEADKANSSFLNFRAGQGIRIGDDIVVIGYPLGYLLGSGIKVTTGNVSALTGLVNDTTNMQLTAPVQPGNSGGALLDKSGNVVGVVVARLKREQNVNLAIKSNVAQMFLDINNINYGVSMSKDKKDVADIADEAKDGIVKVICYQ
ncbi:trypsin-like peptidase domain-containing protein [Sulfurovum lithotrophicum]|uniref:trypsin-like peptidase domain-containing protein n=1 Tax=Sulfurovum lithotrophicum TaxID=206403 RepID=UPI000697908B|nr:trypsin-like peptidase domain-containing protein [Sulfurovum lithotrophicum]